MRINDKILDDQRVGLTVNKYFGQSQIMVQFGCFGLFLNPFPATNTK